MNRSIGLPLLLATLAGCVEIPEEPGVEHPPLATRPASTGAREFYLANAGHRRFAYCRLAPDGSRILGDIDLVLAPAGDDARITMGALVRFRARAIIFTPAQARAFHPAADWPQDGEAYPLELGSIAEDFGFVAVLPAERCDEPSQLVQFWATGLASYLGMNAPEGFLPTQVDAPAAGGAPLCVRGSFLDGRHQAVGSFLFTFRSGEGLTGASGTLPDGTTIALIESPMPAAHPAPDPPEETTEEQGGLMVRNEVRPWP